jgi:hypothetical protein
METLAKILNSLKTLDRRIIFTVTALAVIIPLVTGLAIPSKKITKEVQGIYDTIEKLPPDSKILISFDYDPQTKPECHPMTTGIIMQCFRKNIKVVGIALWPMGSSLGEEALIEQSQAFNKVYGTDYAFLGYKSGGDVVIQKVCTNFRDTFPTDSKGLPLKDIPVMNGINRIADFAAAFSISSGDPGLKQWTIIAHEQTGIPVGGGCTAVSAPEFYPYLNAGQMVGLLGGMQAAAEYEKLLDIKGKALAGMGAQSVVHMVIILFIILANISYFYEKKKQKLGIVD